MFFSETQSRALNLRDLDLHRACGIFLCLAIRGRGICGRIVIGGPNWDDRSPKGAEYSVGVLGLLAVQQDAPGVEGSGLLVGGLKVQEEPRDEDRRKAITTICQYSVATSAARKDTHGS